MSSPSVVVAKILEPEETSFGDAVHCFIPEVLEVHLLG
jgi:hypothetical protein